MEMLQRQQWWWGRLVERFIDYISKHPSPMLGSYEIGRSLQRYFRFLGRSPPPQMQRLSCTRKPPARRC